VGRRTGTAAVLALLLTVGMLAACGKKAPPVAPVGAPLPEVVGFRGNVEGDVLTLSWGIGGASAAQIGVTGGFVVYRSRTSLGEEGCMVCPPVFDPMVDIPLFFPANVPPPEQRFSYQESLATGYRYIYKVAVYGNDGRAGPESEVLEYLF
jgi:hypothetical protein